LEEKAREEKKKQTKQLVVEAILRDQTMVEKEVTNDN